MIGAGGEDELDPARQLELLRAYEPVLRYTEGEYFFPVAIERYLARACLWRDDPSGVPVQEAGPGTLDVDQLVRRCAPDQGLGRSLSAAGSGMDRLGAVHIPLRERPPRLRGISRLAWVGMSARLIDAGNRLLLIFRGSLPGGSAAASFLLQRDHLAPDRPCYYGRVVRDGPWIVCQYWFFYAFNNWRSGFGGLNEHEADWEQVTVYLDGTGELDRDGLPPPRWVAFSAHDETGDDLRRRWDDPDLSAIGGRHPVVYAGAGSHSGACLPGDYLITVQPPRLYGTIVVIRRLARLFTPWATDARLGLGIPYVDYARGDGRSIGPGQPENWRPVMIDDDTPWIRDYRGLWGQDTRDPLGGERGPAGPRYERDGTVRQSWADPVGWAGLSKVAPNPKLELALVQARTRQVEQRLVELDAEVAAMAEDLAMSAAGLAPADPAVRALAEREQQLARARMERARLADELSRTVLPDGVEAPPVDPHAHLRLRRMPLEQVRGARARFRSSWAVLSTPLILIALGSAISPFGQGTTDKALAWLFLLMAIEGLVRGHFLALLLRFLLVVVVIALLPYLMVDWRYVLAGVLAAAGLVVLVVNLREALRR